MRPIAGVALGLVVAVAAGGPADDKGGKIDAEKLVGKWEPPDAPKGVSVVIEFTKDGKLVVSADVGGKTEKTEANYKLVGDRLTINGKLPGGEKRETLTVLKLTDAELVTKDERGKEETLKRVKAKK